MNIYLRQLGISGLQIGLLSSIRPVAMLIGQPLWGMTADIWGRKRTLLLTMIISAMVPLGYAVGNGFHTIVLVTIIYAIFNTPISPIIDSLGLDYLEKQQRSGYGQLRLYGALGWSLAAFAVGRAISDRDIRLAFIIGAVLTLVSLALTWRMEDTQRRLLMKRTWKDVGKILANKRLLLFLLLAALLQIGKVPITSFYAVFMKEIGASTTLIGTAIALQGMSEIPLYLASASIIRRFGTWPTFVFSCLVFAARAFTYSVVQTPALAMLVELTHGLSFTLFLVVAVEIMNQETPAAWRATGQSLFWAAYAGAGSIVGHMWAGFLYDTFGIRSMFRFSGYLIVCMAVVTIVLTNTKTMRSSATAA